MLSPNRGFKYIIDMRRVLQALIYIVMVVVFQMPVNAMAITGAEADNSLLAEQWEMSRSGDALVRIPVINKVVNQWSLEPNQRIELHYPGGEEGDLWVGELRDWMVSLGIPSKYIIVVPGSGVEDVIKLHVVKTGESY